MQLTNKQILAARRKRGERGYSFTELAKIIGINRVTLVNILKHDHKHVSVKVFNKLNDWIIKEYMC